MPITLFALKLALNAGVREYNLHTLGYNLNESGIHVHDRRLVQIFGSAVTRAQNLHDVSSDSATTATFTAAADLNSTTVKSYLNAAAVCPVGTSGTCARIAFALLNSEYSTREYSCIVAPAPATEIVSETVISGGRGNNATTLPSQINASGAIPDFGDCFMVITLDPTIAVTAGGYLTVKGYTGAGGSDSFTYITLQSGS